MRPYPPAAELGLDAQTVLGAVNVASRLWDTDVVAGMDITPTELARAIALARLAATRIERWARLLERVRDQRIGLVQHYPGQGRPRPQPLPEGPTCSAPSPPPPSASSSSSPSPSSPPHPSPTAAAPAP